MRGLPSSSVQERVETSRAGQAAISLFLIATFVAVMISLLPGASALQQQTIDKTQPYLNALTLDQNWGVFAPNPRQRVLEMEARLQYGDGRLVSWHLPDGGPLIGALWDYRWRKLVEFVTTDDYRKYWRPVASFIARHERRDGELPVRVTLVRRERPVEPPGKVPRYGPWQETPFYEYSPGGGRG